MAFSLDAILNIVIPVGIFGFLFFLMYTNIPVFAKFCKAISKFFKEQVTGVKEDVKQAGEYRITYG